MYFVIFDVFVIKNISVHPCNSWSFIILIEFTLNSQRLHAEFPLNLTFKDIVSNVDLSPLLFLRSMKLE